MHKIVVKTLALLDRIISILWNYWLRVGAVGKLNMNAANAITASSGYIYTRKGKTMDYNGGFQTPDVIAAAAGRFVHSNGSPFYPGGTSWYACRDHQNVTEFPHLYVRDLIGTNR